MVSDYKTGVLTLPRITMYNDSGLLRENGLIETGHVSFRVERVEAVDPMHPSWDNEEHHPKRREGSLLGRECCTVRLFSGAVLYVRGHYREVSEMIFGVPAGREIKQ